MAYLTEALLTARVGGAERLRELTDDDNDGSINAGVSQFLLAQVDTIADGYLQRGGYTTPLSAAGDVLAVTPYLLDIANYKAKTRGDRQASEDDRKLYEDALKWFEMVANGDIKLPSAETDIQVTAFELDSPELGPFFNRETLRSW